jgi:hypothetical protein
MQIEPRTKDFYCLVRITSISHLLYEREGCGVSLAGDYLSSFKTLLPAHSKPAYWLKDTDKSILKAYSEG